MLIDSYDTVLCDLDGVVYEGPHAVPGAPETIRRVLGSGRRALYITNNASRTTEAVAEHLSALGMPATGDDIVSSAQAAARLLAGEHPAGSPILVIGGTGLVDAVTAVGLKPVFSVDDEPVAVVQGFDPGLGWKELAEATFAVRRGVPWLATNADRTIPTERGVAPGNGTLVEVVRMASGGTPRVAGKPEPAIFHTAVERVSARKAIMVGDRLDTDISGANRAEMDSLLVLSGISGLADLARAERIERPTFIAESIAGLFEDIVETTVDGGGICRNGDAWARISGGVLSFEGEGAAVARAVSRAVWDAVDAGETVDLGAIG